MSRDRDSAELAPVPAFSGSLRARRWPLCFGGEGRWRVRARILAQTAGVSVHFSRNEERLSGLSFSRSRSWVLADPASFPLTVVTGYRQRRGWVAVRSGVGLVFLVLRGLEAFNCLFGLVSAHRTFSALSGAGTAADATFCRVPGSIYFSLARGAGSVRRAPACRRADVVAAGRGIFLEENASGCVPSRGGVLSGAPGGVGPLARQTRNDGLVERLSSRPVLKHGPRSLTCTRVVSKCSVGRFGGRLGAFEKSYGIMKVKSGFVACARARKCRVAAF